MNGSLLECHLEIRPVQKVTNYAHHANNTKRPQHIYLPAITHYNTNYIWHWNTNYSQFSPTPKIDPHVYQMWWLGMITITNPTEHPIDMYPQTFHPIYCSQAQIGWKQLYYRRISKQWTHYLSQNHPNLDSTKFFAMITQQVWSYILELWTTHNTNNTLATAMVPLNMLSEINGIFATRDHLPQHTQDRIFTTTKEELINKPKQYIQNWITQSKTFIQMNSRS